MLRDVLAHAMAQGSDNSHKIGKSTEWGGKRAWVKSTPSVGTSSIMSVVSEDVGGVEQKFADAAGEDTEVPQEEEVPKKKVVTRKVVRSAQAEPGDAEEKPGFEATLKDSVLSEEKLSGVERHPILHHGKLL